MGRKRCLVWGLAALLGSGQVFALNVRPPLALDGSLCFIDSSGTTQNFVTDGGGPCATTFGEIDELLGTGNLSVWDQVLLDNNMSATLTLFGEGTHTWTYVGTGSDAGPATYAYTFTVGPGQVGGGMLFDWSDSGISYPFGVVNVWDVTYGCANLPWVYSCTTYTSTDWDGDGQPGGAVQDAFIFQGLNVSFDFYATPVPVPAAVWLFGSGLVGLMGLARRGRAPA
ncbi:hypothetical protein [Thiohalobacter sp.]|uniref:hypothetical protein n=1 Tax=Thiohalobacter sp. TaxID=2025948 RepID=UPI0026236AC0|nr:hypothetical protein [Thiohalobacter sp.]